MQDCDFPAAAFREAGYYAVFRGIKGYNGVATLTRRDPESVFHGLCAGPDSEDVRILETVINEIPIINTYVPQGYPIGTESARGPHRRYPAARCARCWSEAPA